MSGKRLLIVGGVAGGASCAARARRLSETARIVLFERGPYVSYANCGLPYHVGGVIADEDDLLVATPELFRDRFNIDVRVRTEVTRIDPEGRTVEARDLSTGKRFVEPFDELVLSPGAAPMRPPLEGIDLPGIFTLRTIPDTRELIGHLRSTGVRTAMVVGAGFIGLEMAENLHRVGVRVTLVEMQPHVMPALDPEMAVFLHERLREAGVDLRLQTAVNRFEPGADGRIGVRLSSGERVEVGTVLMAAGVRPEIELAREAGIEIGPLGGIAVDETMKTSHPHIRAVGDAVEAVEVVTGRRVLVPLAGPANRQGRIAADAIFGVLAPEHRFRGVQATAVVGVLGMTVAATGITEKALRKLDPAPDFEKIYLHPDHHAGYYPDARTVTLKLLFSRPDGRILGAQAVGTEGVEKRIDVIAMAIQKNGTVFDLEEAELCYAPPYGSAKDPVNLGGMIAANSLRGLFSPVHWEALDSGPGALLLDVRDPEEFVEGHLPGAVNIPLNRLREQMDELDRDREIWTYCYVGQRSYFAARILAQNRFCVRNLSGGYRMWLAWQALAGPPAAATP